MCVAYLFTGLVCSLGLLSETPERVTRETKWFSLEMPKEFRVVQLPRKADFDIVSVEKGGQPYLVLYVGYAPNRDDFRSPPDNATVLQSDGVEILSIWADNRIVDRQLLVRLFNERGYEMYIHGSIASGLTLEETALANRILTSLKTKHLGTDRRVRTRRSRRAKMPQLTPEAAKAALIELAKNNSDLDGLVDKMRHSKPYVIGPDLVQLDGWKCDLATKRFAVTIGNRGLSYVASFSGIFTFDSENGWVASTETVQRGHRR